MRNAALWQSDSYPLPPPRQRRDVLGASYDSSSELIVVLSDPMSCLESRAPMADMAGPTPAGSQDFTSSYHSL